MSRRGMRIALRLSGPALLLFGPIVIAAWHLRTEPAAGHQPPADIEARLTAGSDEVREYLARRNTWSDRVIDVALLPSLSVLAVAGR